MFQLATAASASLLSSLILPCLAYNTVNVYFPSHSPNDVPQPLSRFVGLEAFETYGELVPPAIVGEPYQFITSENEKRDVIMISIEDEDDSILESILPSSFSSILISTSSLPETMEKYSSIATYFYSSVIDRTTPAMNEETGASPPSRILDTSVIASLQSKAAAEFFSTLDNAIRFAESPKEDDNTIRFGSFEFRSLKEMRDSVDADVYHSALQYLRALIESTSLSHSVAVLIPGSPRTTINHRRSPQPPPQSPLPIPKTPGTAPIFSTSTCYPTAESCQNSTSSCSSRGNCVAATRAGRTCFVCQCHPAPTSEGGRNVSWAGAMCQKIDISESFSLLAGTVIFVIIIIGGAIALLYSIGSESLPGILNINTGMISSKKDL